MRKYFLSFVALLIAAQLAFAAAVTAPENIPAYWSSVNGLSGVNLFNQLSTATAVGYSSLSYNGLWEAYATTDVYPADSVGRAGEIWDTYSACHFTTSQHGTYSKECDRFNREHTIPQSWWGGGTGAQGCDIFHVLPTDGYVNGWRSNDPYGEVSSAQKTSTNGCKSGPSKLQGFSGTVFEPANQYKGDIARGILGTLVKWKGNWSQDFGSSTFNGNFTAAGHFGLTTYGVDLLMKWHRQDPVSQKEIDRNNGIQTTQGNRNPFIDYPYLAEYIWGEKAGQTVDMSQLMPSTDPAFVPGVSNGWRGGSTPVDPPTPITKYGVNWSVNGTVELVDSVAEGGDITALPATPISCSTESTEFMGWTNAAITGSTDEAPAVLYKTVNEFPAVSEDVTYYAVFAHMVEEEATEPQIANETIVFKDKGYDNAATVSSVEQGYATITFTNAKYYTSGDAVRVYGGGTMTVSGPNVTRIELSFGTGDNSNAITTNVATYTEPIWTGSADAVTFSVATGSGHRKIASVFVQFNGASGTSVEYSRYITTCQETSELIPTPVTQRAAKKVLIGGHIYIQTEEGLFTITGQRVQ